MYITLCFSKVCFSCLHRVALMSSLAVDARRPSCHLSRIWALTAVQKYTSLKFQTLLIKVKEITNWMCSKLRITYTRLVLVPVFSRSVPRGIARFDLVTSAPQNRPCRSHMPACNRRQKDSIMQQKRHDSRCRQITSTIVWSSPDRCWKMNQYITEAHITTAM